MDKEHYSMPKQKIEKHKDTLHFIYDITFGATKFWIVKCFLIWTFIFQASVSCIEIFDILSTFNGFIFVKYGPSLFLLAIGLFSIAVIFLATTECQEFVNEIFDRMDFFEFVRANIRRKILIESKIITVTVAIVMILAIGVCIMVASNYEENCEFYYAFYIFETRMTSQLNFLFSILYYPIIFTILFASLAMSSFASYMLIHQKFQLYVGNDFLSNIASDYQQIEDSILILDQEYQDTIYQRLIRFVFFHQFLKNSVKKFNKLSSVHIIMMMFATVVSYISILYYAMVMEEVSKYQLWTVILVILCIGINTSLFFYSGQSLQDEHSKIKENAWACPWTAWNAKNRKCLFIIFENSKKPVLVGTEGAFVCEYEYGLKIINFMISTSMFFYTMTKR